MIIYSVTVSVEKAVERDWLTWMRGRHIPDVMATGYFITHHLQRLLEPAPDAGMATYNIQYHSTSIEEYERYQEQVAPGLQREHTERFKDRFVAFRTVLERL